MATRRPPLNRGHSMPTYPGSQPKSYGGGLDTTITSLACLTLSDSKTGSVGTRAGEAMRRGMTASASEGSRPTTPLCSLREMTPEGRTHYPTPPYSASPVAPGYSPHTQPSSYFPPQPPPPPRSKSHPAQPSSSGTTPSSYFPPQPPPPPRSKSHPAQPSSSGTTPSSSYGPSSTNLPVIISPSATNSPAWMGARSNQQSSVNMKIDSTPHHYILVAPLGNGFSADSITIAARKGNILVIVAERWDQEQDCHHEWHVQFDRDGDMSSIHANFENGILKITVKRLNYTVRS